MPKEWQNNGPVPGTNGLTYEELRTSYQNSLGEASASQLETARAAYRTRRDHAAKYRVEDERPRACEAWLASHAK
jgi:hypothetical protein